MKNLLIILALLLAACSDGGPKEGDYWTPTPLNEDNAIMVHSVGELTKVMDDVTAFCADSVETERVLIALYQLRNEDAIKVDASWCEVANQTSDSTKRAVAFINSDFYTKEDLAGSLDGYTRPPTYLFDHDLYVFRKVRIVDEETVKNDWYKVIKKD